MMIFYFSIKSLTSIAVAQMTGLSENTISEWRILLHVEVANWLMANAKPIGGPGVIVEEMYSEIHKEMKKKGDLL